MQRLLQQGWFRVLSGAVLIVLGIGGFIAGLTGQPSSPLRYVIGGIVLTSIGINTFRLARQSGQR